MLTEEDTDTADRDGGAGEAGDTDEFIVGPGSDVEPTLSVVLPTLDEEEGIRRCIPEIKQAAAELELATEIVVSDSSSDRTPEIARELGAVVVKPDRMGYGYAYRYAFDRVRGEYVVMGDADRTYDFRQLPQLVAKARDSGADIVLGSRLEGEIETGAMPTLHRYLGNPLLTGFMNVFYDAEISDAHSGMRVIRRTSLEELELQADGMEFATEMLVEAVSREMVIEEVPIRYRERVGEAKLNTFADGWRHVKFMLTNAPGYLFALPAFVFGLVGLAIVGVSALDIRVGGVYFGLQTLIGGLLFVLVGYQVGSLAIFSMVAADPIRRPQDRVTNAIFAHFTLENGATIGLVLFVLGVGFLAGGLVAWLVEGYESVPAAKWNLIAAGVVVLGVQTLFSSFFLSLLAEQSD